MCHTSLFGVPSADYRFGGSAELEYDGSSMLLMVYFMECVAFLNSLF